MPLPVFFADAAERYLDSLPLDLVDEVHVCAPAMLNGQLRDRHAEIGDVLNEPEVKAKCEELGKWLYRVSTNLQR